MSSTKEKVANYLQSNPGWHDSFEIAIALGISKPAVMNQCECLRGVRLAESRIGTGRSAKREYKWLGGGEAKFSVPGRPVTGKAKIQVSVKLNPEQVAKLKALPGGISCNIEQAVEQYLESLSSQ